ncbi:MAG: methionine--tRNA ligase [Spirochaetota bacterium]|jgi:methionyl-tRNA synthetase|nr:methionine--tRNA ligase [Spirochaetota bacterium]
MGAKRRFLVTSALPYANGPIHFGHVAGAYLPADIFVRYLRLMGEDVVYICGTDEHGVAVTITALHEGLTPQAVTDKYHPVIYDLFKKFEISFDNFSRTSRLPHHKLSQEFFLALEGKGLITKASEKQYYCPNDRMFLPDRYISGTCPQCGQPNARGDECPRCGSWIDQMRFTDPRCTLCGGVPEVRDTEHWFLRLDLLQPRLEEWFSEKQDWKSNVRTAALAMLKEGLKPRAVTRDLSWGIPVPLSDAAGKVIYVWFEAPIGYISSTIEWAEKNGKNWKDYWCNNETKLVHFIGKDNIVFHALVFPATLLGMEGYILPENVPANEFYNYESSKFSTSEKRYVEPERFFARYGSDVIRYVITATMPETQDSEFRWKDFQTRNNSELADTLGNFINRVLSFIVKNFEAKIPHPGTLTARDEEMLALRGSITSRIGAEIERYAFRKALEEYMGFARECNRYFDERAPWKSMKTNISDCAAAMYVSAQLVLCLSAIMRPFMPNAAGRVFAMLGASALLCDLDWAKGGEHLLPPDWPLGKPEVLFTKIEDAAIREELSGLAGGTASHV